MTMEQMLVRRPLALNNRVVPNHFSILRIISMCNNITMSRKNNYNDIKAVKLLVIDVLE